MVSLEVVAILLSGISISASLFYYATVLRNQNETRQAQLFMNIIEVYTAKEYRRDVGNLLSWEWTDHDDYMNKYGSRTNVEDFIVFNSAQQWLEGIGVLVRRGLIDPELVFDLMYGWVILFWEKFLPVFKVFREEHGPKMVEDLEYLYDEMKKLAESTGKDASNYKHK